jgi:hypothetical protein
MLPVACDGLVHRFGMSTLEQSSLKGLSSWGGGFGQGRYPRRSYFPFSPSPQHMLRGRLSIPSKHESLRPIKVYHRIL